MISDLHFSQYDPAWPARFADLRDALMQNLPDDAVVDHVGSTAVPGLDAKDCIDLLVIVAPADRAAAETALDGLGYELRPHSFPDDPHRWFWRLILEDRRYAHAHLMLAGHPAADEMLAVRDLLRVDPSWRDAYQDLKADLASANEHDRPAYLAGKAAFVQRMTAAAVTRRHGPSPADRHQGSAAPSPRHTPDA